MRGDNLNIEEYHRDTARQILKRIIVDIESKSKFVISVAGESGSGKTLTSVAIADVLSKEYHTKTVLLHQDDYFKFPPVTNDRRRREDINNVGTGEVRLGLMNEHIKSFLNGEHCIKKPLMIYKEDRCCVETVSLSDIKVLIVEGTYVTMLDNIDRRIFINRTYIETKEARYLRGRDAQDDFVEKVLSIEHNIISAHKKQADIILKTDYTIEDLL